MTCTECGEPVESYRDSNVCLECVAKMLSDTDD